MKNNNNIEGVFAPCITPFKPNGDIQENSLESIIDFLADKIHGISVCAIYGSGILMQQKQRERVTEIAYNVINNRCKLSVFVGAPDTDTSVALARHAQSIGADAITCVAPIYYKQVDEALFRHFKFLIDSVDMPVYLYDSPAYAGNYVSLDVLKRLAESGLKGAVTGAAVQGIEYIWECIRRIEDENFEIVSIRDGLALPAMMAGAKGFESGVANYFPELTMNFYDLVMQGKYREATILQDQMLRLRDISHGFGRNIPTLHALVKMRGMDTGLPKKPFYSLSEVETLKLGSDIRSLEFETPLNC